MGLFEELQTCSALSSSCQALGFHSYKGCEGGNFQGCHGVGKRVLGVRQIKNAIKHAVLTESQSFS